MPLICFASPKGGVGKTTLAANVAHALHRQGRRVLAMDFDPQNALRLHFGVPMTDGEGWLAALPKPPDWRRSMRQTPSGVMLLPHGGVDMQQALTLSAVLSRQPELLAAPMRALLSDPALLVIADMPPGPSLAFAALAPLASIVVCVLKAEAMGAALVPEIESGRFVGDGPTSALVAQRLRVLINAVDLQSRLSRASAEAVARHVGPRLLGAVSQEEGVAEALACQRLLLDHAPRSRAASDLIEVTQALLAALPTAQPNNTFAWGSR
ncbi:cellulose synthase operon protein YhjQ/BcsQ [Roseomonas sp. BN140053]|uniref:cellulose synthase operon protein YhjQ/BcsQ n=1 Tax=Roseomonas sp. BN140053 TaxID=3391898 RepID=UPI0039E9CC87